VFDKLAICIIFLWESHWATSKQVNFFRLDLSGEQPSIQRQKVKMWEPSSLRKWKYCTVQTSVITPVTAKVLVEKTGCRQPHPIAIVQGPIRVQKKLVENLSSFLPAARRGGIKSNTEHIEYWALKYQWGTGCTARFELYM
jgi:hypothetical protein